jgi:hypothetical protein
MLQMFNHNNSKTVILRDSGARLPNPQSGSHSAARQQIFKVESFEKAQHILARFAGLCIGSSSVRKSRIDLMVSLMRLRPAKSSRAGSVKISEALSKVLTF